MIGQRIASLYHRTALSAELWAVNSSRFMWAVTHRYAVTELHGRTAQRGLPASAVVVGITPRAEYLADILFEASPRRTSLGAVPLWGLPRTLERLTRSFDLVIARLDPRWARLPLGHHYLRVPEWVDQWLTVPDDPNSLCLGKRGKSLRKDIRRAHENGITCQVSHNEADLEEFYLQYHLPFVRERFGAHARVDNLRILRHLFRLGGLIWALQNGQRVAAAVFTREGAVFRLLTFASVAERPNLTELGVHTALNWFEVQYAHELGCQEINFGGARGVMTDGVLRHKRKWHTRLVARRQSHLFLLSWTALNAAVRDMLSTAPLLFLEGEHLSAFSVLDTSGPASQDDVARAYRFLWTPGLHRLHLLSPSGFEGDVTSPLQTCLVDPNALATENLSELLSAGMRESQRPDTLPSSR